MKVSVVQVFLNVLLTRILILKIGHMSEFPTVLTRDGLWLSRDRMMVL